MDTADYRITSSLLVEPSPSPLEETSTRSAGEKSACHMRFLRHIFGD